MMKIKLLLCLVTCFFQTSSAFDNDEATFEQEPVLTISTGSIKGKLVNFRGIPVYQFLNIPYAETPIGELRFQKPVAKKPWSAVLEANQWGPHCLQPDFPGFNTGYRFDEDCLVLNVFIPARSLQDGSAGNLRPVMVWIHGGGFGFGSANSPPHYDGSALVGLKDVIFVSLNYRLGPLGFLHIPEAGIPGNMGIWDQKMALQWVQENIIHFGGDNDRVTIFGESAGSISVSAHIVSTESRGLFSNAIMESGSIFDIDRWTVKNVSSIFLNKIGCSSSNADDIKSCLAAYRSGQNLEADGLLFWPVIDGQFLTQKPEEIVSSGGVDIGINLLLGTVGNEGAVMIMVKDPVLFHPITPVNLTLPHARHVLNSIFGSSSGPKYAERYLNGLDPDDYSAIRFAVAAAFGDTILGCPTYIFGRELVNNDVSNVYAYHQTQRPKSQSLIGLASLAQWLPATHCDDIPMVFGHPFLNSAVQSNDDCLLSLIMMDVWTTFAKTGKPPATIGPQEWKPWTKSWMKFENPTMVLDSNRIGVTDSSHVDKCFDYWPFPLDDEYAWTNKIEPFVDPEPNHDEF